MARRSDVTRLPHSVTPLWAWAVITAACLAVIAITLIGARS